jgi:PadR family transcriptional regulator, regulatory protein AphA
MPTTRSTARSDAGTTAYVLLGLLSVRPSTAYELAQHVRRSLGWFWPRAERKLYDDPKRLVADGLATAAEEPAGRRKRTVYAITAKGRRELADWLGTPSAAPSWENEALVKVSFADAGDLAALRRTLTEAGDAARERLAALADTETLPEPLPQRRHLDALTLRLHQEHEEATARWADWALAQTESWPSTDDPGEWNAAAVFARLAESGSTSPLT